MIISVLSDKRIKERTGQIVKQIKQEFELSKTSELEIDLNEFYYRELNCIVEEYMTDAELYPEQFEMIVDHLILKAKDAIYNIQDIAIEKVTDEDDTYIITRISPFRYQVRDFKRYFNQFYINPIDCVENNENMDYQVELAEAYREIGFIPNI